MVEAEASRTKEEADLYDVVPERFVAARDDLARRLRSAGDKVRAARVAKSRRPPLTAWALNQVARTDRSLVDAMFVAGGGLRYAMQEALHGDASGLREAHGRDRAAVEDVVGAAVARMTEAGYSVTDAMRLRMAATLRAAVVDESVAILLRDGTLDREREAPGFGIDALSLPPSAGPARPVTPTEAPATSEPTAPTAVDGDVVASGVVRDDVSASAALEGDISASAALEGAVVAPAAVPAEAKRLAGEARELVEEAIRLEHVADRLEGEAVVARQRANTARRRADAALATAAAARAGDGHLRGR